jgi:hypothetical protein
MNEKIKELALQAGGSHYPDVGGKTLEKFAELLIQECMNQVREQYIPVMEDKEMMKDTHWDGYVQCGVDSVVGIREYFFGVEE